LSKNVFSDQVLACVYPCCLHKGSALSTALRLFKQHNNAFATGSNRLAAIFATDGNWSEKFTKKIPLLK